MAVEDTFNELYHCAIRYVITPSCVKVLANFLIHCFTLFSLTRRVAKLHEITLIISAKSVTDQPS